MVVDYWLFDMLNGLAGRSRILDTLGQYLAVYGALAALLFVLAVLWWPNRERATRRQYFLALLVGIALCAVFFALEWVLTSQILHHALRARPANARWATLLISAESQHAFPAWPVIFSCVLALPTVRLSRALGAVSLTLAGGIGLALIFTGINFPFDVFTGIVLGCAIGYTANLLVAASPAETRCWRRLGVVWLGVVIWAVVMAVTIKPVHSEGGAAASLEASSVTMTTPAATMAALHAVVGSGQLTVQAARNAHLLAASVQIILPDATATLPQVTDLARKAVNAAYASWPELGLVTVDIAAIFQKKGGTQQTGTLYTATVARTQFPEGGFANSEPLPGRKFYHARFLAPQGNGR